MSIEIDAHVSRALDRQTHAFYDPRRATLRGAQHGRASEMGNLNRNCRWPNCGCKTEQGDPCKFENPDFYIKPQGVVDSADYYAREIAYKFMGEVWLELCRARGLFPSNSNPTVGLMEEVGELAQAVMKVEAGKWPSERIRQEAIQVCVMAMRVALEGDPSIISAGKDRENM